VFAKPVDLTGAAAFVALMAVLPLVFPSNYLIGVLTVSVLYGIWAVTWDFMSGLTGRENFGHASSSASARTRRASEHELRLQRLVEPAASMLMAVLFAP
jgi:ABC-type branched-subunit amino acid transport system permease subunit